MDPFIFESHATTAEPAQRRDAAPVLQHEEAYSRCEFLIHERRPFGLVTGPAGSGKSQLLRRLAARGRRQGGPPPVQIDMTGGTEHRLLAELVTGLGVAAEPGDHWRSLQAVRDRLEGHADCGSGQLLLLDHLDAAEPSALKLLTHLLRIAGPSRSLTVIGAARLPLPPALQTLMVDFGFVRIELGWLGPTETREFLRGSSRQTGDFDPRAWEAVHSLTRGQPRQVDRLVELVLLANSVEGTGDVSLEMVHAAFRELPAADAQVASA